VRPLDAAHEPRDVPAHHVVLALAGLVACVVLAAALVIGLLDIFGRIRDLPAAVTAAPPRSLLSEPRLQAAPAVDRQAVEAAARARLEGYGWTDEPHGRARIPIERAMQLQLEMGWPDAAAAGGTP